MRTYKIKTAVEVAKATIDVIDLIGESSLVRSGEDWKVVISLRDEIIDMIFMAKEGREPSDEERRKINLLVEDNY